MLLAVVIIGGLQVIAKRMSLGDLGAFLEYANNVIWPMEILGWLSNDIASAVASWKEDSEGGKGDDRRLQTRQMQGPLSGSGARSCLIMWDMSVAGRSFCRMSAFGSLRGETLGIMGMTGTGKTTIVNLLQRFYDVTSGRILLDGQDIRTIPLIQLRAAMSVVMQEVFLFSDSVSENVKTGRREDTASGDGQVGIGCGRGFSILSRISQNGMRQ